MNSNLQFRLPRILLILLLLAGGSVFFTPQAHGQTVEDNGLEMRVRPGYDGFIKQNYWYPIHITVSNNGPSVDGDLIIRQQGDETVWKTAVSLPNQSRKQITLQAYTGDFYRPVGIEFVSDDGVELLSITSGFLNALDGQTDLMHVVVAPEPDTVSVLENVHGIRKDAKVAYIALDELPSNLTALQMVDTLTFVDVDTNGLSSDQRSAIESWVQKGGQLVITAGASWQKTSAAFSELLPVEILATESIEDLPKFGGEIGVEFRDPGPYVVASSSLKNGSLVYREDSLPILARRPEGAGNVWFLALDPQFAPLDDWDGSEIVWDSIARFVPRPVFWERNFDDENSLAQAVSTIPSVQLPSVWLVLGFMGLYILILGPLNYLLLNRLKRRELAWLSIPTTVVLFSVAALLIGLQFRGNRVIINQLSVVTGRVDQSELRVETAVGVFSPRRANYDILVNSTALVRQINQTGYSVSSNIPSIRLGNNTTVEDILIDIGDVHPFAATTFNGQSPIIGQATLSEDGAKVTVKLTNTSDGDFLDSLLLIGGTRQEAIFNIAAGETIERTFTVPNFTQELFAKALDGKPEAYKVHSGVSQSYQDSPLDNGFSTLIDGEETGGYYQSYGVPESYQRYSFLSSLYSTYDSETVYTPADKLVLIGWTDEQQLDVSIDGSRFDTRGSSLYFIEIPLQN